MAAAKNGIRELHALYGQLREVQNQLQSAPRQIKVRQQGAATRQAEIDATKEKMKKLKASADQSNLQVKTNESKVLNLKVKLNQASSNREFDALRSEIEADEMANSVLEDEVLAAFEKLDRMKEELSQQEAELAKYKAGEAKLAQELESAAPGLRKKQAELEAAIASAEQVIPSDLRSAYGRMSSVHGPDAFAEVEGNQCQACFVSLPPQTLVELKNGGVVFCKSCGKVLYLAARSSD